MATKRKGTHAQKNQKRYNGKYTAANSRRGKKDNENRTGVIVTCVCVIALGIAFLAGCLFFFGNEDGVIYEGVRIAGVKVGGMTVQEAKAAVEAAAKDTYGKKDMVVTVLQDKVTIPAEYAGKLDVTKADTNTLVSITAKPWCHNFLDSLAALISSLISSNEGSIGYLPLNSRLALRKPSHGSSSIDNLTSKGNPPFLTNALANTLNAVDMLIPMESQTSFISILMSSSNLMLNVDCTMIPFVFIVVSI